MNDKHSIYKYIGLVSAILFLCIVTVSVGVSYSRYQSTIAKSVTFSVRIPAAIEVTDTGLNPEVELMTSVSEGDSAETVEVEVAKGIIGTVSGSDASDAVGWVRVDDGGYLMNVYINNQNNMGYYPHDIDFKIYLNTTLAAGMEGVNVYLYAPNANGIWQQYSGMKEAVSEESILYYEMGEGYQYHFPDAEGNELVWTLDGDSLSELKFVIKLEGVTQDCLVEVVAEEVQAQK